jgi:predicted Zn-dependent peptidase/rhamnogalacturonyl hydrolase YesR
MSWRTMQVSIAGFVLAFLLTAHAFGLPLPAATELPRVSLPHAQDAVLENGLRIRVLELPSGLPTFTAQLVLTDGGGLYEPPDRRGLAAFTAEMLREGTAARGGDVIARELETLGVKLEAKAAIGSPIATITVSGLATRVDATLALMADLIRNPAFRDSDVARHATVALSDLQLQRARPEFLSQEQLLRAIYGTHPAALAAAPAASVQAITREDLRRFHDAHYRPNGAVLVVVGAVKLERILPELRRVFGDWQPRTTAPAVLPAVPAQPAYGIRLIDRPGSVQTVFQIGVLAITRNDPDYFPLLVMNQILGGQSSSRLYQNLREQHGYTYGAYSALQAGKIPGVWQLSTSVRTAVTADALRELLAELNRIRAEPATAEELASAKRALIGKYIFELEEPQVLLDNIVTQTLYDLPANYWDGYPQRVQAVSIEDVEKAARKWLDLEHLQIAAVGDVEKIRAGVAQYGPLQSDASPAPSTGAAAPAPPFSDAERARFGRTVEQIADELIAVAEPQKHGMRWPVTTGEGDRTHNDLVNFYTGTPGDSYFLLKAYQALGKQKYLRGAERGMDYLLSQARTDAHGLYFHDSLNGVFEGNAGPGYLFLYAYQVTGRKSLLHTAESIARRMVAVPDVGEKSSPDIISGASGAGLFLLDMYAVTGTTLYLDGARRLGDFLVEHAEPRGTGVTWKLTGPPGAAQPEYYFVGFSHGPAGVGYYLDRLYRVTHQDAYRDMADRAMAFVENIAIEEKDSVKWYHEELKRRTRYSSQWCHGAPGMNPFFLELHERSAEPRYLEWARRSTRYLLDQGVNVRLNPSVCHGVTGNTASLYMMYRKTADPDYLATIRSAVELLYDTLKQGPQGVWWDAPDYDPDYKHDYSYMTGLAGIGDFFVLLYSDGKLNMFGPLGFGDDISGAPRSGSAHDGRG